jgi:hypothetical protein
MDQKTFLFTCVSSWLPTWILSLAVLGAETLTSAYEVQATLFVIFLFFFPLSLCFPYYCFPLLTSE